MTIQEAMWSEKEFRKPGGDVWFRYVNRGNTGLVRKPKGGDWISDGMNVLTETDLLRVDWELKPEPIVFEAKWSCDGVLGGHYYPQINFDKVSQCETLGKLRKLNLSGAKTRVTIEVLE